MRKNLSICLVVALVLILVASVVSAGNIRPAIENRAPIRGDEPMPDVQYYPSGPVLITQAVMIGETQYDYQQNGSTGNRVFLDSDGGKHFSWMKGTNDNGTRHVFYNYLDADDNTQWPNTGTRVSENNLSGYTTISALASNQAVVAYHHSNEDELVTAIDQVAGFAIFDYFFPPNNIGVEPGFWPFVTVDRSDNIHVVMSEAQLAGDAPQVIGYTMSTNGGIDWTREVRVDTVLMIAPLTVSSPVSDKVAIAYTHQVSFEEWSIDDLYYIESEDGLTWDWEAGKINVTEYGQGGDSLWIHHWCDIDAVYDYNDNLHIIWSAQYVGPEFRYFPMYLYHFDTGSETITEMGLSDTTDFDQMCDSGAFNQPVAKLSLGVLENTDILFATYTYFPHGDCSAGGFANGEIYMQSSFDGGASWSEQINLTNSPSPDCIPGECDSDHWSTLAERVDGTLHIIYINDKDAGGIPQGEGSITDNPVMYLAYAPTAIDGEATPPRSFALSQNYPNPFNAKTNIEFELLEDSRVELSVYDITGAKVTTLVNGEMEAGAHSVNWDANKVASGVYYYSLKANGEKSTRKMTLLK